MRKQILSIALFYVTATSFANNDITITYDTTKVVDIEEVVVISSPKENAKLRELPTSVSLISQKDMQAQQINSIKNISALTPNFYMPDYGSRITSAMYIRGIGSRMNTPAVGLYVDNIPYVDKSAYDFNFYDIERIDILRGPQGTLYGRNTMGGLIKIHTRSPFSYQGTDLKLGYATKNNHRSASLTHYHRWSDKFAFSAGGYYEGSDGFFTNSYNNTKIDKLEAGGGRIRAIWLPSSNLKIDFTTGYDYTDEGGYPYFYTGTVTSKNKPNVNKINYNHDSKYRRGMFNSGINLTYQADKFVFSSVTGYQNIKDRMFMDQDFLPIDIYTLEQKQHISSLTQEFSFKNKDNKKWQWVTGVSGVYQWLKTESPVTFMKDGLKNMIERPINNVFNGVVQSSPIIEEMNININNETLPIYGNFKTPTYNAAIFHQSTFNNFITKNLSLTLGARLEHEHLSFNYLSGSNLDFLYNMKINMTRPIVMKLPLHATPYITGEKNYNYLQFLPKIALKYDFSNNANIYTTISKGYRSGGYNIQMISDIISNELQNKMAESIMENSGNMKDMVKKMLEKSMPNYGKEIDINTTKYKPEYSWNYEIGTHLNLFNNKLFADFAAFYVNTHDQQITKFVDSGLGRIMVNAGKSESYGLEASLKAAINKNINLMINYGYTEAKFTDFNGGDVFLKDMNGNYIMDNENKKVSKTIYYNGNYVPFVPKHTLNIGGDYSIFIKDGFINKITLGSYFSGAGRIYWTESNNTSQSFYGTLNGNISLTMKNMNIDFWGKNLTDKRYTTFYFESMNNGFKQINKPLQLGVDIRYHF